MRSFSVHLPVLLLLTLLSSAALAQTDSAPAADSAQDELPECTDYVVPEERRDPSKLVLRGVSCFETGQYVFALKHYRRARKLSDENALNAAIGRTFQELGYPFIARRYFRDYLSGPTDRGQGRAKIEQRLQTVEDQLEKSAAEVEVTSSPPGAEVYVAVADAHWEELGETPLTVEMLPGKRRFIIQKDGFVSQTHDVSLTSGGNRKLDAALVDSEALFGQSGRALQRAGVIITGISLPVIAGGVSMIFVGGNRRAAGRELEGDDRSDEIKAGAAVQQLGIVGTVVGATLLGTGVTLYLVGRGKAQSTRDEAGEDDAGQTETAWRPRLRMTPASATLEWYF